MQENVTTKADGARDEVAPSSIEALKEFCRTAAAEPEFAAIAALAKRLRAGASCAHVEQELADATLEGLRHRFGSGDLRTLLDRRMDWRDSVGTIFACVEDVSTPGAARALWAHLARALASACPPADIVALGPVHCAVFDVDGKAPIPAPEGADTIIVSIRSGGAEIAAVEAPVFRETTLGDALRARPGRLAAKLLGAQAKPRIPRLAAGLAAAAFSKTRAATQLARGGARKARVFGLVRNIADAALRRLDTPLFDARAPSAQDMARTPAIMRRAGEPASSRAPAPGGGVALVPVLMYSQHRAGRSGRLAALPNDAR